MVSCTAAQQGMINTVSQLGRRVPIQAGPRMTDVFGRRLELNGRYMRGTQLGSEAAGLLKELQTPGSTTRKVLDGQVAWYDVRSSVWKENPSLSALMGLAYASTLIDKTGQRTGHTVNIAVDCYPKHHISMSDFADTLIRTGIVQDGGGIVYWGVQNGGAIRNVSQFERAVTGKNGSWAYGTMSHREEDYLGSKFGMLGQVFCGLDLIQNLYGRLVEGRYPEIMRIADPEDYVVTVGDMTSNNIDVAEDMIRARTGTEISRDQLFKGLRIGINMCGSPVGKNMADMAREFGADVVVENEELNPNYNTANIIDPNEHESRAMQALREKAAGDGRIWIALDPDGDRMTFAAKGKDGVVRTLTGTQLLLLATENLATYNPQNFRNDVCYDKRTGVSIRLLARALREQGHHMNLFATEPGYPFFMEMMGKEDAAIAVENTAHPFLTPFTNPIWGAPKFYSHVQGGDDGAMFAAYLLGLCANKWDGRNPVEQFDHIRAQYGIPQTRISEYKPTLTKETAMRKYDIAKAMVEIAKSDLGNNPAFEIDDTMESGVGILNKTTDASVLQRYSNTGPGFTVSGEAITPEQGDEMFRLAGGIMAKAVERVEDEHGDTAFNWKDFAPYKP